MSGARSTGQLKKGARPARPQPETFAAAMDAAENEVRATFQLWGDLPHCSPKFSCEADWLHVLMSTLNDVAENARQLSGEDEESEKFAAKAIRRHLATLAKACEMWAEEVGKQ